MTRFLGIAYTYHTTNKYIKNTQTKYNMELHILFLSFYPPRFANCKERKKWEKETILKWTTSFKFQQKTNLPFKLQFFQCDKYIEKIELRKNEHNELYVIEVGGKERAMESSTTKLAEMKWTLLVLLLLSRLLPEGIYIFCHWKWQQSKGHLKKERKQTEQKKNVARIFYD